MLFAEVGAEVVGLDTDTAAIAVANARLREHHADAVLQVGDVTGLPFPDSTFELVISHNVLEHIPGSKRPAAIGEMARVIKPGGLLFVQAPNRNTLLDVHTSRLPLLHLLPRGLSGLITRIGVPAPHEDLPTFNEILSALRSRYDFDLINHCDVWMDLADFLRNWTNYSNSFGLAAKVYFRAVPVGYLVARVLRTEFNRWSPVLNLFLRKK